MQALKFLPLKLIIILFLTLPLSCFSQDAKKIKQEIEHFFDKADKKNLQNILPFEPGFNKTGLIEITTKKIILKPTEGLQIYNLFNPIMKGYYKGYSFEVNADNFEIKVIDPKKNSNEQTLTMEEASNEVYIPKIEKIPFEKGFKGFSVNDKGKLTSCSSLYFIYNGPPEIRPFKYKGVYYAVAGKKDANNKIIFGIIDTQGNANPHFNFTHNAIWENELATKLDEAWFVVNAHPNYDCKKLLEDAVFINMEGEMKLKGELANSPYSSSDLFGLNLNFSGCITYSGILDIKKMEWIIKPQEKFKIRWMEYTSKTELDKENIKDKSKATIYLKILDGDAIYFMDFDSKNKYFPGKN